MWSSLVLLLLAQPVSNAKLLSGPPVGAAAPALQLTDTQGRPQTLTTLAGPNGLLLAFLPSADWCPYCKAQLVELEQQRAAFARRGIHVAALTNESPALLANFARRRNIRFPLLSDAGSRTISAFGLRNDAYAPGHEWHGVPHPGVIILDRTGKVRAKYFETDYRERTTAARILGTTSPAGTAETAHLKLRYSASNAQVRAGNRLTLRLQADIRPGQHLYAPGVATPYRPAQWQTHPSSLITAHAPSQPAARRLSFPSLGEDLPIYTGQIEITRDITIGQHDAVAPQLHGNDLVFEDTFTYQACTDRLCFPPTTIPLRWKLRYLPPDLARVPEPIRQQSLGIHLNLFRQYSSAPPD